VGCITAATRRLISFASAIGLRARTELLKARRSARTRATTFMLIGAFLTLAMIGIAATAFAALK
jgi:hypothetical protein